MPGCRGILYSDAAIPIRDVIMYVCTSFGGDRRGGLANRIIWISFWNQPVPHIEAEACACVYWETGL